MEGSERINGQRLDIVSRIEENYLILEYGNIEFCRHWRAADHFPEPGYL